MPFLLFDPANFKEAAVVLSKVCIGHVIVGVGVGVVLGVEVTHTLCTQQRHRLDSCRIIYGQ